MGVVPRLRARVPRPVWVWGVGPSLSGPALCPVEAVSIRGSLLRDLTAFVVKNRGP